MTRTRRQATTTVLAAVLLAGAAGCGGEDSAQTRADPATPSPTSPPAPSITPAAGIQLTEASSTIRVPVGWKPMPDLVSYASAASDKTNRNSVDLVDSGDISGGGPLDPQAKSALRNLPKGAKAKRLPNVELDGVAAFHIHYTVPGDRSEYDTITTVRKGRNVGLDFILEKKYADTNPDLIASVLTTFRWIA